jgi:hypothetical protein
MKVFERKSRPQRLLDTVKKSIPLPSGIPSGLPAVGSGKAGKASLIAAGSLAGLTAASAGVSSLRRQREQRETQG